MRGNRIRGVGFAGTLLASLWLASVAAAGTGGAGAPRSPQLKDVICVEGCADIRTATIGGKVQLKGRNLRYASRVVFPGGASAPVEPKGTRLAEAQVPSGARSGRPYVRSDYGSRSGKARKPIKVTARDELGAQSTGEPSISFFEAGPRKFFYGSRGKARIRYIVGHSSPIDLRVDVVRAGDGAVVRTWIVRAVQPNALQQIRWNGRGEDGAIQPEGAYRFRISQLGADLPATPPPAPPPPDQGSGAGGASPETGGASPSRKSSRGRDSQTGLGNLVEDTIVFYRHMFPIRGRHDYGRGGGSRFGAGRGGRSHQGQDVFARCGTRLVAARGGKVKFRGYHGQAGYYTVIDGEGTDVDYAYMHLVRPARVPKGRRVYTGQRIGEVGDSGNARGCHLHFEMWGGPGWYDGGRPFDPLPHLRAWDAFS